MVIMPNCSHLQNHNGTHPETDLSLTATLIHPPSIKLVIVSAHFGTSIGVISVNLSLNGIQLLLTCLIYSMILTETEEIIILVYVMNESLSLRPYSYIYNSFRK